MLSVLRRLSFAGIVIFYAINSIWGVGTKPLIISIVAYLVFVISTIIYCKVDKFEKMNFIEVIVREDLRDPLISSSKYCYQAINQFFSTFLWRKWKNCRGFKEKMKLLLIYLIILICIYFLLCVIMSVL